MKLRTAVSRASLFLVFLTIVVWAAPIFSQPQNLVNLPEDTRSVTGKISAVGDASFTVNIAKINDLEAMQFTIDNGTKVEGKLIVGSQATVEYRSADGINIATHVVVQPTVALDLY